MYRSEALLEEGAGVGGEVEGQLSRQVLEQFLDFVHLQLRKPCLIRNFHQAVVGIRIVCQEGLVYGVWSLRPGGLHQGFSCVQGGGRSEEN